MPAGARALFVFYEVRTHYRAIGRELASNDPVDALDLVPPVVLLPMRGWSVISRKALRFALKISHEIYALHIAGDEQTMVASKTAGIAWCASRHETRICPHPS